MGRGGECDSTIGWISCNLRTCRKRNSQAVTRLKGLRRSRRGCRCHRRLQKRASETLVVGNCKTDLMGASDIPEAGQQSVNTSLSIQSARRLGYWGKCANKKRAKLTTQNLETRWKPNFPYTLPRYAVKDHAANMLASLD